MSLCECLRTEEMHNTNQKHTLLREEEGLVGWPKFDESVDCETDSASLADRS